MDWDAIGAIGEIIAALAVLITLIYLANQIRQTNNISAYNSASDLMNKFNDINQRLVSDPHTIEIVSKLAEESYKPKSKEERDRIYSHINIQCNLWASVEIAYLNGQIDKELYEGMKADVNIALERWPSSKEYILEWLSRYSTPNSFGIFQVFREG